MIYMEMIDEVNEKDQVIGQVEHDEIYNKSFNRRIVHVLIFNNKGEMAIQFRSKKKRFLPQHWVTSAGGHVQAGENCKDAAIREMEEEIGINLDVEFLYKDVYKNLKEGEHVKFLYTYKLIFDGPFKPNFDEIEKIEFFSLDQIQDMIDKGEKFHPELFYLLNKHYNIKYATD